jgi:hypothetical protein
MSSTRSTKAKKKMGTNFWFENFMAKGDLGDPAVNVRIFSR